MLGSSLYCESDGLPVVQGSTDVVCHFMNIRSISSNLNDFITEGGRMIESIDFMCFAETRLSKDIECLYKLNKYRLFANSRCVRGGGVAVYAREKFNCRVIDNITCINDTLESIFLECTINSQLFIIGCIYRPPSSNVSLFCNQLEEMLGYIRQSRPGSDLVLVGDMNIDLFTLNSDNRCLDFVTMMYSSGMFPLILRPTRIGSTSATLIDHIWSNNINKFTSSGVVLSTITDHYPIFMQMAVGGRIDRDDAYTKIIRRENNYNELVSRFNTVDWSFVREADGVNNAYNGFADRIECIFSEVCPLKEVRVKKLDLEKPYITRNIKNMIKEKHRLQKLSVRKPITYGQIFKDFRKNLNKLIRKAESEYYRDKLANDDSRNGKCTWGIVNDLLGRGTSNESCGEFLLGDSTISDPRLIADEFNKYFSTVGSNLADNFDVSDNYKDYLSSCDCRFSLVPTTPSEIKDIVKGLRTSATGSDGIPVRVFKENIDSLADIISYLCNFSIERGRRP